MGRKKEHKFYHIDEVNLEIDYDKLAKSIIAAEKQAKQENEAQAKTQREALLRKREEVLGVKDYSNEKCWIVRKVKYLWNTVWVLVRLLFIKKEDAQYFSAVDNMLRGGIVWSIDMVRFCLFFLAIIKVVMVVYGEINITNLYVAGGFVFGAQFLRIAKFEVNNMKDRENLMAVLATIISMASLAVSIVAIFLEVT